MRWSVAGAAVAVIAALGATPAYADPAPPPDLGGYRAVDIHSYGSYYDYPTTNGRQFATPGGYRCRITYTGRANPAIRTAQCWGNLPGTVFNSVAVTASYHLEPATFGNANLTDMETYRDPPSADRPIETKTISPDAYRLLPPGSKLTFPDSATCAVTAATTTCVLGEHGFVLDPVGSRTF